LLIVGGERRKKQFFISIRHTWTEEKLTSGTIERVYCNSRRKGNQKTLKVFTV
jgi:hypothetical protein